MGERERERKRERERVMRPYLVLVGFLSEYGLMPFATWALGLLLAGTEGHFTENMAYQ